MSKYAIVFFHQPAHCICTSSSDDLSYDIHYLQSHMTHFIFSSLRSCWQIIFKFANSSSSLVSDLDNQLYITSSSLKDLLHYISISNLFSIQLESESELSTVQKKPVTTMLTYPWKCTVLHCNHLGNTWKPLVLMTRHFDYCPSTSEANNQSVRSSAPVVSRCFPGGYNVKLYISRGRLAWWLLAFMNSGSSSQSHGSMRVSDPCHEHEQVSGLAITWWFCIQIFDYMDCHSN